MFLSILTTMYQSSPYLEEFYRRAVAVASRITEDFELVFVDDGSPDDSFTVAERFLKKDPTVRLVRLARNYGHHRAIMAGLSYTQGNLVFLIDCDLEEPPELLEGLYQKIRSSPDPPGVVYAVQRSRKGQLFEQVSGRIFYSLFNLLSGTKVPVNCMMARLMTRPFVESLKAHQESEIFLSGVMRLAGFRQEVVEGDKRHRGVSSYSLRKRLSEGVTAITSFSDRPLWVLFLLGSALSLLAFLEISWLVFQVVILHAPFVPGWASVLAAICFFGGLNLLAVGIVGVYLSRIFLEVKKRPCIVQEVVSNSPKVPREPLPV